MRGTVICMSIRVAVCLLSIAVPAPAQARPVGSPEVPVGEVVAEPPPRPRLVTAATRTDARALAALETPGRVLFDDDFESRESFAKYFEVRGRDDGRAVVVEDRALAHSGAGALQLTAPARDGAASGAGVSGWFGDAAPERVHLRYWLKWDAGYDQGNLNHTGGSVSGVAGTNRWGGMGKAGIKPVGDDRFSTSFETWVDWGRAAVPGYAFLYTYWMDMERDRDGNHWGNMLAPEASERFVPERGRWYCFEVMVANNRVGESGAAFDGELATWIDGRLYMHWQGLRLRSSAAVRIARFGLDVYVHRAVRDNRVWFDDVVVSTGYVGTATPHDAGSDAVPSDRERVPRVNDRDPASGRDPGSDRDPAPDRGGERRGPSRARAPGSSAGA